MSLWPFEVHQAWYCHGNLAHRNQTWSCAG